jgi:hypothetical protein
MTPHDDRELEVLDEEQCLTLLGTVTIGRLAFTEAALPAVQPVSFAAVGGEIFIPTRQGSQVATASRGAVVAFEVDDVDARARTGWNVTVVGPSRVISNTRDVRRLDELGARPWPPADTHCYIGVQIRLIRGRRIRTGTRSVETPTQQDGDGRAVLPA